MVFINSYTTECNSNNKLHIISICLIKFAMHIFRFLLKDEDLQEMEDLAQKMETQFGQFLDHVIVNDSLQDACAQLLSAVQKAQEEPHWVPATWVSSDTES